LGNHRKLVTKRPTPVRYVDSGDLDAFKITESRVGARREPKSSSLISKITQLQSWSLGLYFRIKETEMSHSDIPEATNLYES
jgi:hypothetical protein